MEGNLGRGGIGWYLDEIDSAIQSDRSDLIPHVAGLSALALSYGAAGALIAMDGPLPFGDAIAVGILAVPDIVIYGVAYSLFD